MYIGWNLEGLVESCRYYFWKEMIEKHNTVICEFLNPDTKLFNNSSIINKLFGTFIFRLTTPNILKNNDIKNIRNMYIKERPDIVVFEERLLGRMRFEGDLGISVPKILILNDYHHIIPYADKLNRFIRNNDVRLCLSKIKYYMNDYKKYIDCNFEWLPFSVPINIFRNYGEKKKYDIFSSGIISPMYTLRYVIKDLGIEYQKYTNYGILNGVDLNNVREGYAKKLSQSKIFLFGNSTYLFPIQKYFEGMASDCLVMAPEPHDSKDLHFIPGRNFVNISQNATKNDVLEEIKIYIDDDKLRGEFIKNANNTIKKYHTVDIRIKEFNLLIEKMIG